MCTRFLWSSLGEPGKGNVLVGRSMDWYEETDTVLAVRPRGVTRGSAPNTPDDPRPFTWTSVHGSVVALMYGKAVVDGINEVGLQVSGLYLSESDYGVRDADRPGLELYSAIQCLLDRFDTVAATVEWFENENVQLIEMDLGGKRGTGHIAIADPSGDSAIIEFIDGKTDIHHGSQYTVMANSPEFEEQLEIQQQYPAHGGDQPLPGGVESPDRFARAAYFSAMLPVTSDPRTATAYALSVIRNASAPFGTPDEQQRPEVSITRWRTLADLSDRRYLFESTTSPNLVWVELSQLDFAAGGPELLLDLVTEPDRVGNVTDEFTAV
jgi:penicillin V acylase-like amidase (Ntn superfamily)